MAKLLPSSEITEINASDTYVRSEADVDFVCEMLDAGGAPAATNLNLAGSDVDEEAIASLTAWLNHGGGISRLRSINLLHCESHITEHQQDILDTLVAAAAARSMSLCGPLELSTEPWPGPQSGDLPVGFKELALNIVRPLESVADLSDGGLLDAEQSTGRLNRAIMRGAIGLIPGVHADAADVLLEALVNLLLEAAGGQGTAASEAE